MNPLVSVIIPVYNTSKYLRQCINSILSQTLEDIEIICVDDGSTDDSFEIISDIAMNDTRVRIFQQENKGSGAARNYGITESIGEFVAFMDSDDWYPSKDVLETLYNLCTEFKVSIAGGSLLVWDNEIKEASSDAVFSSSGIIDYSDYQNPFFYTRFIYSRQMLQESQVLFPDYLRGQDPPFLVKAMATAGSFYMTPKPTYCYRLGHKTIKWDVRKTNDYMKSIIDLLHLSLINTYSRLHLYALNAFQDHYSRCIKLKLDYENPEFSILVEKANGYISTTLVRCGASDPITKYILSPFSRILFRNSVGNHIIRKISQLKSQILCIYFVIIPLIQRRKLMYVILSKIGLDSNKYSQR